jgi:uncharacterized RDD family membrane protein YckC
MHQIEEVHVSVPGSGSQVVPWDQFEQDIKNGAVPPDTMVWHTRLGDWKRAHLAFPQLYAGVVTPPAYTRSAVAAPPEPPVLAPSGRIIANPWLRVCSHLLDGLVSIIMGLVLSVPLCVVLVIPLLGELIYLVAVSILPFLALNALACTKLSATPGQYILGMAMEDDQGLRVSVGQVIGRTCVSLLSMMCLGLGYIWVWFTTYRQTWHDAASGVYVIMREKPSTR